MLSVLFVINGFIIALVILVSLAAVWGLRQIFQGKKLLAEINLVHNQLSESVAKIDGKAQEALLRLDHLDQAKKH